MGNRASTLRTTLLLGTVFLAGMATGPVSHPIARHFVLGLGIEAAFGQDTDRAKYLPTVPPAPTAVDLIATLAIVRESIILDGAAIDRSHSSASLIALSNDL